MRPRFPEMKPCPPGATFEQRLEMHREYVDEMVRLNPRSFLPLGVERRCYERCKQDMTRACAGLNFPEPLEALEEFLKPTKSHPGSEA